MAAVLSAMIFTLTGQEVMVPAGRASVTVGIDTFLLSGYPDSPQLRMRGLCPVCGRHVWSMPLRGYGDWRLQQTTGGFRPGPHGCVQRRSA